MGDQDSSIPFLCISFLAAGRNAEQGYPNNDDRYSHYLFLQCANFSKEFISAACVLMCFPAITGLALIKARGRTDLQGVLHPRRPGEGDGEHALRDDGPRESLHS